MFVAVFWMIFVYLIKWLLNKMAVADVKSLSLYQQVQIVVLVL